MTGVRIRDVAAIAVIVLGGAGAALAWHPLGRWPALAVALGALVVAGAIYRLRPSAVPWRGEAPGLDDGEAPAALRYRRWTVRRDRPGAPPRQ